MPSSVVVVENRAKERGGVLVKNDDMHDVTSKEHCVRVRLQ